MFFFRKLMWSTSTYCSQLPRRAWRSPYATAQRHRAILWTQDERFQDERFQDLPGVKFFSKSLSDWAINSLRRIHATLAGLHPAKEHPANQPLPAQKPHSPIFRLGNVLIGNQCLTSPKGPRIGRSNLPAGPRPNRVLRVPGSGRSN